MEILGKIQNLPFFWNKVNVDNLDIEILEEDGYMFLKLSTNGVNIKNVKIEMTNKAKLEIANNAIDLAGPITEAYYEGQKTNNYDEFKKLSNELIQKVDSL